MGAETKRTPERDAARGNQNTINVVLPDVYLGMRFVVAQYPIAGRSWSLALPYLPYGQATDMAVFHTSGKGSSLVVTGSGASPAHPFDEDTFLPPKNLYELGKDKKNPQSVMADLTVNEPLVKSSKKGYRAPQDHEKSENSRDAADLNKVLGQALAVHVSRDKTYDLTMSGRFMCSWIAGQKGALVPTEKLALVLYAYVKATIDGKPGIYEIKDGLVTSTVVDQARYDKLKRLEVFKYANAMALIPGVLQVHILLEQDDAGGFSLKEVHCDGDQVFPEP